MRPPLRVLICVNFLSLAVAAQAQAVSQDVVQVGTKSVHIPPPDGFAATFARFARFRDRFLTGQNPGTSVVEVHVPASVIADLEKDQEISLSFYSGVGIPDASRAKDATVAEFRYLVGEFEKQHDAYPDAKEVAVRIRRVMDKILATRAGPRMDQPTSLGYFQREQNAFSGMVVQPVERMVLLIAFSFLHVKDRIIYLQFYRKLVDETDAAILRDAVTKWTTAIVAANK